MQLLSALDQIVGMLWLAIGAAAAFVVLGMTVHATVLIVKRYRRGTFNRAGLRV
jgi:hypothetical protein